MACAKKPKEGHYTDGYAEGGSGGIGEMLGGLMGGSAGGIGSSYSDYLDNEVGRQERMINYRGSISMQSTEPEIVIDTVVAQATAKGGFIDERSNGRVALRIPVQHFRTFFDYILTLGNVYDKEISATDISKAYMDNATKLRIAESTLARLQQLLATAKTELEKMAILAEIQRVSEQIEQRKLKEKKLISMAVFSTITLSVHNTVQDKSEPLIADIKAFAWFANLPNVNSFSSKHKALKLNAPKDFIEAKYTKANEHKWGAASALNSEFWAFERENNPQGTHEFWANAMLEYFKNDYNTELKTEENFSMVRLQSEFPRLDIYYIAVLKSTDKKTIKIAGAYFPNKETEEKNSEAIIEVLRRAR